MRWMPFSILILLLVSSVNLIAQIEDYNFEGYRQAEVVYKGLVVDPNLISDHQSVYPGEEFNSSRSVFSLGASIRYFSIENTAKTQSDFRFNSGTSFSYNQRNEEVLDTRSWSFREVINAQYLKDSYRNYNRFFTGINVEGAASWQSGVQQLDSFNTEVLDFSNQQPGANVVLGFRLGWGRLENISNAWHSYRILNRLHFIDRLKDIPTVEQINSFGQYLGEIKTYRLFDNRLRNIALLQFIDGYLRDELGLVASDIKYFSELNDMYRFGITAQRIKGTKWILNPKIGVLYNNLLIKDRILDVEESGDLFNYGTELEARIIHAFPWKRDFQFNFEGAISGQYTFIQDDRNGFFGLRNGDYKTRGVSASIVGTFAFYPTTRTEWIIRSRLAGTDGEIIEENLTESLFFRFTWSNSFGYRYFLSPFTTLNVNANVNYDTGGSTASELLGSRLRTVRLPDVWNAGIRFQLNHIFY